jgi:hypothetical protein
LLGSLAGFTHVLPPQFTKPTLQVREQMPKMIWPHTAVPLGLVGHTCPQEPQLFTSVLGLRQLPEQFTKPAAQELTEQAPAWHVAVPLRTEHTVPQVPQLFTLEDRLTSQPSA